MQVLVADGNGGATTVDATQPMTIQQLFTHTSGLTYNFLVDSPVGQMYLDSGLMSDATSTLAQIIDELARLPLAYQPGSRWHYSMSIDVLAHLIEVIADQPLADFLHERIFAPLGMVDTGFAVAPEKLPRVATVYGHPDIATHHFGHITEAWLNGFNERIELSETYPTHGAPNFARGGHGLFSTSSDYMRFAQMLLNRGQLDGTRILGRKTVDLMHKNHVPMDLLPYFIGPLPSLCYGFGLGSRVLLDAPASALVGSEGEFGWAGAAKTYYWIDPVEEIVGLFMSQFMVGFDLAEKDFQALAYQALVD